MVFNAFLAPCLVDSDDDNDKDAAPSNTRILTGCQKPVAYLDHAGQAPLSDAVIQAGIDALHRKPWESQPEVAIKSQQRVRYLFANLIGADASDIAIHPSTAFAMSMAAENIFPTIQNARRSSSSAATTTTIKDKVLVLQDEFNSAVYPWQNMVQRSNGRLNLAIVPCPTLTFGHSTWTDAILDSLDASTLVASLTPLHWSNGTLIDLMTISRRCKELNIMLMVDSTQATGIFPCNIQSIQPDLLCCSVHKWLRAPLGASLVYINPALHELWEPLDQHARGRDMDGEGGDDWEARLHPMHNDGYPTKFYADARKFDAGGKVDPIYMPMLAAALEEIVALDVMRAQEQLATMLQPLMSWCALHHYQVPVTHQHCHHLIGIRPPHLTVDQMIDVAHTLAREENIHIAVRCGCFRISPYLDSGAAEIQRLLQALEQYGGIHTPAA
jgi:selenocysteine lyase/cysteine desulfurase